MLKLSIKEYMRKKNISRQTIYNHIERGLLETIKEGNKTYIVKEIKNPPKSNKMYSDRSSFMELQHYFKEIHDSYEILKNFDYNFLKSRLSSIEKALVDFKMDGNRTNDTLMQKIQSFIKETDSKLNNIDLKFTELSAKIEKIFNEGHDNFLEKYSSISEKYSNIDSKIEKLSEKLDELLKKSENNKKSLNPFKK